MLIELQYRSNITHTITCNMLYDIPYINTLDHWMANRIIVTFIQNAFYVELFFRNIGSLEIRASTYISAKTQKTYLYTQIAAVSSRNEH